MKNNKVILVVMGLILAMYNVVIFVVPFQRTDSFWVGYIFSIISMILMTLVASYAFNKETIRSKYYKIPLVAVCQRYMAVQLIVGVIQMFFFKIPAQYSFAVNVVLIGCCLIGLITVNVNSDEVVKNEDKVKEKVFWYKQLTNF